MSPAPRAHANPSAVRWESASQGLSPYGSGIIGSLVDVSLGALSPPLLPRPPRNPTKVRFPLAWNARFAPREMSPSIALWRLFPPGRRRVGRDWCEVIPASCSGVGVELTPSGTGNLVDPPVSPTGMRAAVEATFPRLPALPLTSAPAPVGNPSRRPPGTIHGEETRVKSDGGGVEEAAAAAASRSSCDRLAGGREHVDDLEILREELRIREAERIDRATEAKALREERENARRAAEERDGRIRQERMRMLHAILEHNRLMEKMRMESQHKMIDALAKVLK